MTFSRVTYDSNGPVFLQVLQVANFNEMTFRRVMVSLPASITLLGLPPACACDLVDRFALESLPTCQIFSSLQPLWVLSEHSPHNLGSHAEHH